MLAGLRMDNYIGTTKRRHRMKTVIAVLIIPFLAVAVLHRPFPCQAATRPSAGPPPPALTFSVPSGVYTNDISVQLATPSPAGVIRYTLNGSDPTGASPKYSGPIDITNSTLLKVKVFDPGSGGGSATVSQAYLMADPDLAGFNSNLPLVILNSFGQRIPHGERVPVVVRIVGTNTGPSTLTGPAEFAGLGELNVRGNTSLRFPKHSYHLKTTDDEHNLLKVGILGFSKDFDWVLYAPYVDKTMMRDILGYELSNQMGRYAARTKLVEVFLNESVGRLTKRHYVGVYVLEEKIKRGKHRVDIDKLGPEDNAEPEITGGYIIKKDHTDRAEVPEGLFSMLSQSLSARQLRFNSSQGNTFFYVEPKATEITGPQKAWLRRYLNSFESALYGDQFRDPKTGYAAYIDTGSFIDHHWLVEVSKNIDGFRFSTFYHKDRGGKLHMGPIWDWNLTFGNASPRDGYIPEGWYWPQLDDHQYSWFRRLFEDPDFTQQYVDRWGELRTNQFAITNLHQRIDQLASLLNEAQARNYRRWRILGENVWPNQYVGRSFSDEVNWLKQWMAKRIRWIDQQFLPAPAFSLAAGPVDRGDKLELKTRAGKIYYTLDGTDPRAPGGGVAPGARPFGATVVLNKDATVFCRAYQGNRWSYPALARFSVDHAAAAKGK